MISRLDRQDCVGCASCSQICPVACITMQEDDEGFPYPAINTSRCTGCNLCERACPILSTTAQRSDTLPDTFLTWTTNEDDLMAATSGGAFTALARQVLAAGGVVVGAAYDDRLKVSHIVVESENKLYEVARSKYVQSDTSKVFAETAKLLEDKRSVLFCGTTCQVYSLLAYCRTRQIDTSNLALADIVCHGVPSPKLLREYIRWLESNSGCPVVRVSMRERGRRAMFGFTSKARIEFANGKTRTYDMERDLLGRFFLNDYASRPSCHKCAFKTLNRLSDLTLGDCWFSRCLTTSDDTPYEVTLCLAHSERGLSLLTTCPDLRVVAVDAEDAIKSNGGMLYTSANPHPKRDEFLTRLGHEPLDQLSRDYFPPSTHGRIKAIRGMLKVFLRKLAPRAVELRAQGRQQREFDRRVKRSITPESRSKRVFS